MTDPVPEEGAGQMIGCGLLTLCLSMSDQGRSGEYQPVQKRVLIPDQKQYTTQWKITRWNPPGIKTQGESTVGDICHWHFEPNILTLVEVNGRNGCDNKWRLLERLEKAQGAMSLRGRAVAGSDLLGIV